MAGGVSSSLIPRVTLSVGKMPGVWGGAGARVLDYKFSGAQRSRTGGARATSAPPPPGGGPDISGFLP